MAYEAQMSKLAPTGKWAAHCTQGAALLVLLFLAGPLAACGPREIGHDMAPQDAPAAGRLSAAEQMRYPLMGTSSTQFMLHQYNRPEVMEEIRSWHIERFNRLHGVKPAPEDPEYRATPRQNSPFRQ